ncbi:MAG: monovalent cation/H+ antiporter subunit D family protein [Alphaproteobacteria bacterium]|nr:monovalent cation/H+ antiporter subunit D family protein [Alphaproteobacteria bacterium]
MSTHLPILQVLVPLLAAPVLALLRGRTLSYLVATGFVVVAFLIAIGLTIQVVHTGAVSYAIGNWAPPLGIEYRIDELTVIMLLMVTGIASAVLIGGGQSIAVEIPERRAPLFFALFCLNVAGLIGMTVTGDVFNLFVFLEISSLSTYALVAMGRDRRALTAAYQYLVIGTVGATFYVIGVGLLYMMTGTLNMADLTARVSGVESTLTIKTALAFLFIGLGVKLGMMPVHFWLPNAYAQAPSTVSAFLAGTATKVAVYVMLRIVFGIFGIGIFTSSYLADVVIALGIFAMVAASVSAIFQSDAKRLLAYSSLAQIGYILFALGLATEAGLTAAILHLFNHGLMKATLFLALTAVALRLGRTRLEDFDGLAQAMPATMLAFAVAALSLVGVPLTIGFVSKWYLLAAAFDRDGVLVAAVILGSSLLALLYLWPLVERAYFRKRPAGAPEIEEAPLALILAMWALVAVNVFLGVNSQFTVNLAANAARHLIGAVP